MDERNELERAEAELREISAEVGRESAGYSTRQYNQLHRLCDATDRYQEATRKVIDDQERRIGNHERQLAELGERLLNHETEQFMDRMETDMDIERWDGRYAAQVAHGLEDVGDNIIKAIETIREGGDPDAAVSTLFKAHMDVCDILADMAIDDEDEEDGATLVEDIAEAVAALWRVVAHLEELAEETAHRAAANAEAGRISEWCQELHTIKKEAQRSQR